MINKETLKNFPLLNNLQPQTISALEQEAKIVFFNEHDNIINKGDSVGGVYLVLNGCLRVYTLNINGKESTLYNIKVGESCVLSMNCVFANLRYPAWVSSSSPLTQVLVIKPKTYKVLYESDIAIRNFTTDVLSQRIFDLMSVIEEALSFTVEQKIASYLIRKSDETLKISTSHRIIAAEVGTAREVVSRTLKRFEEDNIVSLSRGNIQIESIKALNNIC